MNEDQVRRIEEAIDIYESKELYSKVRKEVEKENQFILILLSVMMFLTGTSGGMLVTYFIMM